MELSEYMELSKATAVHPDSMPDNAHPHIVGLLYCAAKLCGEAGEVSEQIGKALRDDGGQFTDGRILSILKEMGDVQWYLARVCFLLGIDPDDVLRANIEKLKDRRARGVIHGSGSDR